MSRSLRPSAAVATVVGAFSVASLAVGGGAAGQLDDAAQVVLPAQRVAVPDDPGPAPEQDAAVRLTGAGFAPTAWGENIAAGLADPQPVFAAWLDSPEHLSQLIGDFRFVGIASVASDRGTPYWTLILAS